MDDASTVRVKKQVEKWISKHRKTRKLKQNALLQDRVDTKLEEDVVPLISYS
jgi:hypothetical protein